MIIRQVFSLYFCLFKFLRVSGTQNKIKRANALSDEIGKIFGSRRRFGGNNIVFAKR